MRPDLRQTLLAALSRDGAATSDFDLNPELKLPPDRVLRPAAVLVPIIVVRDHPQVILTKRSPRLRHHPGQIAFPGGKQDPGDPTLLDAALRETEEEIGLPRANVEILGELPCHETVTGFHVTPIVGLIRQPFEPRAEAGEVSEVFQVPLSHLLDIANFHVESRIWQGQRRYYFTVPYGPYYVWGATARMLRALADRMAV
ncbi:CoA pyrophosphatase [Octadecabacter sp. R77987]|uniref:CoA pyrophosphatase n=1 Tax=Octadecabacter sp. R77987 TaxID=3093874 RepID=UPI0036726BF5